MKIIRNEKQKIENKNYMTLALKFRYPHTTSKLFHLQSFHSISLSRRPSALLPFLRMDEN